MALKILPNEALAPYDSSLNIHPATFLFELINMDSPENFRPYYLVMQEYKKEKIKKQLTE